MFFKSIISFFFLISLSNIFAQNDLSTWTLIKKAEQTEIYADFKGLKKSGNMSTIWLLENYSKAKLIDSKDGIRLKLSMKLIVQENVKTYSNYFT